MRHSHLRPPRVKKCPMAQSVQSSSENCTPPTMSGFKNLSWKNQELSSRVPNERDQQPAPKKEPEGEDIVLLRTTCKDGNSKPVALEICCGHAGLSAALWDAGLKATGIDWAGNKHQTSIPIVHADLTTKEGQEVIWHMIKHEVVVYIHMGPPCGTFTRAREKPIPTWQLEMGAPCPRPLRSTERPYGLPAESLSSTDQIKVEKGNRIADFCVQLAFHCMERRFGSPSRTLRTPSCGKCQNIKSC